MFNPAGPDHSSSSHVHDDGALNSHDGFSNLIGSADRIPLGQPPCITVQKTDLCSRCCTIDLGDLFSADRLEPGIVSMNHDEGVFIMDLEATPAELSKSDCLLCKLFGSLAFKCDSEAIDQNPNRTCHLAAYPYDQAKSGIKGKSVPLKLDRALISVVDSASLVIAGKVSDLHKHSYTSRPGTRYITLLSQRRSPQIFSMEIIHHRSYDISFVRYCSYGCRQDHGDICNSLKKEHLSFFRPIDCQSRRVIMAPSDSKYVALSYVWDGPVPTGHANSQDRHSLDLCSWPKVITDSIQVTLDIGLKYLWVDRYCINQDDDEDKATQIAKMDLIYSHAEVTIIAAAGEGPEFGSVSLSHQVPDIIGAELLRRLWRHESRVRLLRYFIKTRFNIRVVYQALQELYENRRSL